MSKIKRTDNTISKIKMTDNTISKIKRAKGQTLFYKTLHRKPKTDNISSGDKLG
jgi:hypothetical protein